jgi:hypothetical protein
VKAGKLRLKLVEADVGLPLGKTWALAVTGYEMVAPLHTFWVNDSDTELEAPAGSGLGLTPETMFFLVSPKTESNEQSVLPVLDTLYTTSNPALAQLSAVKKLLNWLQSTDEPPKVHLATAICDEPNKKHISNN